MFVATFINFLLSSWNTGTQVLGFFITIRKALVLDIDYLLSERPELVNDALQILNTVNVWAGNLPVSDKPSLLTAA